jgi:hypothetical protein
MGRVFGPAGPASRRALTRNGRVATMTITTRGPAGLEISMESDG